MRPLLAWLFAVVALAPALARPAEPDPSIASAIETIVSAGRLADLRWPDFSDYRPILVALYGPRAYTPVWTESGRPSAALREVAAVVAEAAARGLDPADYDAPLLAERIGRLDQGGATTPGALAALDVLASVAILRHVSDVHVGRVNPESIDFALDVEPRKVDLAQLVTEAARDGGIRERVEDAEPKLAQNQFLESALATYRGLAAEPTLAPALVTSPVKPGERLPDFAALARWLVALGDLSPSVQVDADADGSVLYDGVLVDAVKHFQGRHGLTPDGVIGAGTAAALAVPAARRVRQIELALERLRWLPDLTGGPFVIVNVPAFELFAFERANDGGRPRLEMRVIVGKAARTQTPILAGRLAYLEFRPYWNVPRSIAMKEILPKLRAKPGYLAAEQMELVRGGGDDAPVVGLSPESMAALAAGTLRIRQRPGPKNALGRVKFIFPNVADVYLHDTPSQALFARDRRDFSHGCVRLADPLALAEWALHDQPEWTRERILAAMEGERRRVFLRESIPVILFYSTAIARDDGSASFYGDIYGHDLALERALARGYPYPR